MKRLSIALALAGLLTLAAGAQTGANGSASTQGSVSAGQNGANAGASQDTQISGAGAQASTSANTTANANASGASLAGGTVLQAELTKSLDSKKAKSGDPVIAQVTQDVKSNGQVVIRKGSKLMGHVTEAQARGKENSESRLGLAFDKAVLKNGSEVALNAVVQALGPGEHASVPAIADDNGSMQTPTPMGSGGSPAGMGGGPLGSTAGSVGRTVGQTAGAAAGAANSTVGGAGGALSGASRGVVGLPGLTLNSGANGTAQGSVISSATQNVKLESGTQMILQVAGPNQR